MALVAGVNGERRQIAAGEAAVAQLGHLFVAGGGNAEEGADRGGIVDVAGELRGQTEQAAQPITNPHLQLGGSWRGLPQHGVDRSAGGQQLAENAGLGAARRKVGEETRMVPVGKPGFDQAAVVRQHLFEAFGLLRGFERQLAEQLAGVRGGQDRPRFDVFQVVGYEVGHLMQRGPELFGIHALAS